MNQSIESIKAFFDFSVGKPYWKIQNLDQKTPGPSNLIYEDPVQSWQYFERAYNSFLPDGNYRLVLLNDKSTADSKGSTLNFIKNTAASIGGFAGFGMGNNMQQMLMMQMMYPHLSGVGKNTDDKIERLQEENKRLTQELTEAKFSNQIEMLKRDNKDKKKVGLIESAIPLLEKHLPSVLAFAGGQMTPRAAVGIADSQEPITIPTPQSENNENQTLDVLPKANVLQEPGLHSIDHAWKMLEILEDVLPEYNINCVLQNLVLKAQTDPASIKMLVQNFLS